jgi:truncated hemoglobin YjbI
MNSGSAQVSPLVDNACSEDSRKKTVEDEYLPGDTGLGRQPGDRVQSTGCFGFLHSNNTSGLHETVKGYCTAQSRIDWCRAHGVIFEKLVTSSLNANPNPSAPLYYWQLYSLLGIDNIRSLIADFYDIVFKDTETPWFRDVFVKNGDIDHHIRVQAWYWADAMGGGAHYHGGEHRLNFHHGENAGKVVMSAAGAKRWMEHMKDTLISRGYIERFNAIDRRILPCLTDFLHVKMHKYAVEFDWPFDRTPFDELLEIAKKS